MNKIIDLKNNIKITFLMLNSFLVNISIEL